MHIQGELMAALLFFARVLVVELCSDVYPLIIRCCRCLSLCFLHSAVDLVKSLFAVSRLVVAVDVHVGEFQREVVAVAVVIGLAVW